MSKKQKHHHEEHVDETWLIPYADMLTLLLALFIVLFAASSVDVVKFEQLAQSLSLALTGGTGIMENPSNVPLPESSNTQSLKETRPDEEDEDKEDMFEDELDFIELEKLKDKIDAYIAENDLESSLETNLTRKGLLITILNDALFASGSAEVRADAQQLAREISQLLVTDPPRHVTIGGHTDTVPISNFQFRSNWDLSAMRAINFMKILLNNTNLEPQRFSATGYGEHRPVASNQTEAGRAQNRRVEVLILPWSD